MDGNAVTDFGRIYYTAQINEDLPADTTLTNVVRISSTHDKRVHSEVNGNQAPWSIRVLRNIATSLTKKTDQLYVDWWADIGYSMHVGNNSGTSLYDVVVDALPFNSVDRSAFTGQLVVTEFSAGLASGDVTAAPDSLEFYYTTELKYAGCRSENLPKDEVEAWTPLTKAGTDSDGRTILILPDQQTQQGWGTYDGTSTPRQITAIAAVGDIPSGQTLEMHVTMKLPQGREGDYLINYVSQQSGISHYARTVVVNRVLALPALAGLRRRRKR